MLYLLMVKLVFFHPVNFTPFKIQSMNKSFTAARYDEKPFQVLKNKTKSLIIFYVFRP